jgi:23S rRNA (pseudouridine1915-N3)-methyltransferase
MQGKLLMFGFLLLIPLWHKGELEMSISILCIGKIREPYLKDAANEYIKRIKKFINVKIYEFNETKKLLEKTRSFDYKILLDVNGLEMSSEEFAEFIKNNYLKWKNICFVIGGWEGFDADFKDKMNKVISLSKMTFPYQLSRVILLEQLYRAFTIIKGIDYSK